MILGYLYEKEESPQGTWFKCYVPEGLKEDMLERLKRDDELWEIGLKIYDPRLISNSQRRLLYALFRDIGVYTGYVADEIKEILKIEFMVDCNKDYFSLSDVDKTTAKEFIEYTLEFIFKYDIPLSFKVQTLAREVNNYLYLCLVHRKCCICGKKADVHHVDAVGMGRDRTKIDHTKHRLIALCSKKCHKEAHDIGWLTFKKKHHVDGIKVNQETVKKLGI